MPWVGSELRAQSWPKIKNQKKGEPMNKNYRKPSSRYLSTHAPLSSITGWNTGKHNLQHLCIFLLPRFQNHVRL
jgi:hypothetical protein